MIYVECKPDEILVRFLTGLPKRQIAHEFKGKPEVCRRISEARDTKGMIDEDPGSVQPTYLSRITLAQEILHLGLKVYEDSPRNNRLVVLCPKLEDWVLRAAGDALLNMSDYGLPNTANRLHRVINVDLRKFERLMTDLNAATSNRLKTLQDLLN